MIRDPRRTPGQPTRRLPTGSGGPASRQGRAAEHPRTLPDRGNLGLVYAAKYYGLLGVGIGVSSLYSKQSVVLRSVNPRSTMSDDVHDPRTTHR